MADYNPGWRTVTVQATMNEGLSATAQEPLSAAGLKDTQDNSYATEITPEIQRLASSLNDDPRLMYEYVLNNIDYVPYLGSLKGATLTYLDRSGNDYDQASLLIALLHAAGYSTADFDYGRIAYPVFNGVDNYDLQHWLGGPTDESAIAKIFSNGGYHAIWNGNHTITLDRVWVTVQIGTTWYKLDPAFKRYQVFPGLSPSDLITQIGYSREDFLGAAGGGTDPTTAQNMDETGLDAKLDGYVMNLVSHLQQAYPNNEIEDIVGGRRILREDSPQLTTAIRFFPTSPADTTVNYFHTVSIKHGSINETLTLPTIAGRRLAMIYDQPVCIATGGAPYGSGGWDFGTVCPGNPSQMSSSFSNPSGATVTFTLKILNNTNGVFKFSDGSTGTHTYSAAAGGSFSFGLKVLGADSGTAVGDNVTATLQLSAPGFTTAQYPLIASVKPMAKATLLLDDTPIATETTGSASSTIQVQVKHPYVNTRYNDASPLTYTVVRGGMYVFASEFGGSRSGETLLRTQDRLAAMEAGSLPATPQQKTIETLNVMGQTWLRETTLFTALGAWATNTWYIVHHRIGLAGQNTSYYVDIKNQSTSTVGYSGSVGAGLMAKIDGLILSSLEHGVLEQLQAGAAAVSTIKILATANSDGQKLFLAKADNYAAIQPQLQQGGYSASELQTFANYINSGTVFFLPELHDNQINQWTGAGYIQFLDTGNAASIGMIIGGGLNGGFSAQPGSANSSQASSQSIPANTPHTSGPTSSDPIDLVSGAYLLEHTDLTLGSDAPLGLALGRSYTSQSRDRLTTLGYGWRHSYDLSLSTYSDGAIPLGLRRHADAGPAIVAALAIADLMQDTTDDPATAQKWLAGALTAKWLTDSLVNNSVSLYHGREAKIFTRLPDGSFVSPPGVTSKLVFTGGLYKLLGRDGSILTFISVADNDYRASMLTDANGNTLSFSYTGTKLASVTDTFGRQLNFTYTGNLLTSVSDSAGRSVGYGYDDASNLVRYTDPESNIWAYGYAGRGQLATLTDPLSQTYITNTYDSQGKVPTQVALRQGGQTATYTVTVNDYRSAEVDPFGNADVYFYDRKGRTVTRGRVLSATPDAVLNRVAMVYDGQNHPTRVTDPNGYTTTYTYDGNGNLTQLTDPLGKTVTTTYDPNLFRPTKATDPLGHFIDYAYTDPAHPYSVTETTMHPSAGKSISTQAAYGGPKGLLSSTTDGNNVTTNFSYTLSGYITGTDSTTGSHPKVEKTLDQIGRVTKVTDQHGTTWGFSYDKRGLVLSKTDPLSRQTVLTYRADGNLSKVTDRNQKNTTFGYTPSGKVESITYADGSSVGFTYDLHDRLTGMADAIGQTTYAYDGSNRPQSSTSALGATVSYDYDAASNVTKMTYPDGRTVSYTHDALNRLATVSIDWLGKTATYTYDAAGRAIGLTQFNGTVVAATYDDANRLTDLENLTAPASTAIAAYHFTLDANGNRVHAAQDVPVLTTANRYNSLIVTYNAQRNRLQRFFTHSFTYDDEGQLAGNGVNAYTFDFEHRLTGISGATNAQFRYDGAGNRLEATRNGVVTRYIYDLNGNLIAEMDASNAITRYYIHGAGLLATVTPSGALYCYHFDATGHTVALTDSDKQTVNAYAYTPFGTIAGESETVAQPFKYAGKFGVMSEPNDYYYMRARYYDPQVGRFISEDPLGFDGGDVNLYAYVLNNPVLMVDPDGELGIVGAALGAGIEFGVQMAMNGGDINSIDWVDVAMMGAAGAVTPSFLGSAGKAYKSFQATKVLSSQLSGAKAASKITKLGGRIEKHTGVIKSELATQGAIAAGKYGAKKLINDPGTYGHDNAGK
ncbi:MAG: RHS repeat-associated core domain-containing protein [Thermodesulfobacteriota bacterium]